MQKESRFETAHWPHQDIHGTSWNSNHFSPWAYREGTAAVSWRCYNCSDWRGVPSSHNHAISNLQMTCVWVGRARHVCVCIGVKDYCRLVQALGERTRKCWNKDTDIGARGEAWVWWSLQKEMRSRHWSPNSFSFHFSSQHFGFRTSVCSSASQKVMTHASLVSSLERRQPFGRSAHVHRLSCQAQRTIHVL